MALLLLLLLAAPFHSKLGEPPPQLALRDFLTGGPLRCCGQLALLVYVCMCAMLAAKKVMVRGPSEGNKRRDRELYRERELERGSERKAIVCIVLEHKR